MEMWEANLVAIAQSNLILFFGRLHPLLVHLPIGFLAVLAVLVAFGIRYLLTPVLGEELPFMLFIAAALIAAWYGGAATGE